VFEIGNSLREARVRQQLELGEVELATKIRARYLRALEEESFEALPAQTYVKGFLRTYADYLGLDGQLYVAEPIPNLATTNQTTNKVLPPATPTKAAPKKPASFTLYVRAQHGNSWMDVRNWSQSGKALFTGTVELGGQDHRWVSRRLWITFGAPANLGIVWNGHLVDIHRSGAFVFTPRGFSRAA
jgi:hypothetical protein